MAVEAAASTVAGVVEDISQAAQLRAFVADPAGLQAVNRAQPHSIAAPSQEIPARTAPLQTSPRQIAPAPQVISLPTVPEPIPQRAPDPQLATLAPQRQQPKPTASGTPSAALLAYMQA